jgi:hypothetical protein
MDGFPQSRRRVQTALIDSLLSFTCRYEATICVSLRGALCIGWRVVGQWGLELFSSSSIRTTSSLPPSPPHPNTTTMSSVTRRSLLTLARARPAAQSLAARPSTLFARRYQSSDDFSPTGKSIPVPEAVNMRDTGLNDGLEGDNGKMDWSRSFHGLSTEAFPKEVVEILTAPLDPEDVEIKPGNSTSPLTPSPPLLLLLLGLVRAIG